MYKYLLCWRYLRTRYIALASIISVMLGVATMIVVNSVMAGFTHEMQERIHGILSDVIVKSHSLDGFPDAQVHMQEINRIAGDYIAGMTPTVHTPAMVSIRVANAWRPQPVTLIGIDTRTHASVSDFGKYLQHPANRKQLSFELREGGYDNRDRTLGPDAPERVGMSRAGWEFRRILAGNEKYQAELEARAAAQRAEAERRAQQNKESSPIGGGKDGTNVAGPGASPKGGNPETTKIVNPFDLRPGGAASPALVFDSSKQQHTGAILGMALASVRDNKGNDIFLAQPGSDVLLTVPTSAMPPKFSSDKFTVTDLYESKMSEYDSSFVFVPIETLQDMRVMYNPTTGVRSVNSIQILLKHPEDAALVRDKLRDAGSFRPDLYGIYTWRDEQGALLAAVEMEKAVLNLLLFMIIAVAGFGILAIFFMIVVEKTRDIGIMKSLGASRQGIMGIFLSYGLMLGVVGSGVGMVMGLLIVNYLNEIRRGVEWATGQQVFDPSIYYFYKIPTIIEPFTVAWIVVGALSIAVLASVVPALRAARLHPVEALRYE